MQHRIVDVCINSSIDCPSSCKKMVKIGSVVFELKWDRIENCVATWPKFDNFRSFSILATGVLKHIGISQF